MLRSLVSVAALSVLVAACGVAPRSHAGSALAGDGAAQQAPANAALTCSETLSEGQAASPVLPLSVTIDGASATLKTATNVELGASVVSGMHAAHTRLDGFSWYSVKSNTSLAFTIELFLTYDNSSRAFGWGKVNLGGVENTVFLDCKTAAAE